MYAALFENKPSTKISPLRMEQVSTKDSEDVLTPTKKIVQQYIFLVRSFVNRIAQLAVFQPKNITSMAWKRAATQLATPCGSKVDEPEIFDKSAKA